MVRKQLIIFTENREKMKAIEIKGKVDKDGKLHLFQSLDIKNAEVKVIILYPDAELEEQEWLSMISHNPTFSFLTDVKEDIYTLEDGKPFQAE